MRLADYLRCNLDERNRLLASLNYAPVYPVLSGAALAPLMAVGQTVLDYLPLPAYMINRDWSVLAWNDWALRFMGMTHEQVMRMPADVRHVLHFIFNPDLPVYRLVSHDPAEWHTLACRNILGFKLENLLCQFEGWFEALIARLKRLPRFEDYWETVQPGSLEAPPYVTQVMTPAGPAYFRSLLTLLRNDNYPQIVSYVPADDASRRIFSAVGLPTPENGWGTQLPTQIGEESALDFGGSDA